MFFLFSFLLGVLAFWSHLELTPFLKTSRLLTLNPLSFVDNLLYCTQKPQYFVTLKVIKPKLRLNFIPSLTCGAYSYLLLGTSIIKFWYLVYFGGNKWNTSIANRKTRTARAKGTSQAHGNYQQYANWLSL